MNDQDITERKQAESQRDAALEALKEHSERLEELVEERTRELRETQEQLVRREKLAVLGQLAGGVARKLRNPLGAIKNAAYILNMVLEKPDVEIREMLEVLVKALDTAENIISSLLALARTRPPLRRTVDLSDVVQEALSRTPGRPRSVPSTAEGLRSVPSTAEGLRPASRCGFSSTRTCPASRPTPINSCRSWATSFATASRPCPRADS